MDSSHSYRVTASWGARRNGKVTAEGIVTLKPTLSIAQHQDRELANRLLAKADEGCLIARSLACAVHLQPLVLAP